MESHEAQKAKKLTIQDVARKQLDKTIYNEFEDFLGFLTSEKIRQPWKSINGFKLVYKSKNIGGLTLGAGGWLDNNILTQNYVLLHINTTERHDYDNYLHGASSETTDLFMEQISHKCVHCRPTCGCSHASGRIVCVLGNSYENVCMNAISYKFYALGESMKTMMMCTPRAVYPPENIRAIPLASVKNLIVARKAYIEKYIL